MSYGVEISGLYCFSLANSSKTARRSIFTFKLSAMKLHPLPIALFLLALLPLPALATSLSERFGQVQADYSDEAGSFCTQNPVLKINRAGVQRFNQVLQSESFCRMMPEGFRVEDLDNDGEPEVLLDFFSGGAHCCLSTQIFSYLPATQQYQITEQFWGDGGTRELKDLDQDGIPEFLSYDTRFAYAFASFAGSGFPIQIWQYRQGQMRDVTRQFPDLVYRDASRYWQLYTEARAQNGEVKGILAAYLADKYLLGQSESGWRLVRDAYQEGDRLAFFGQLNQFLQEQGYEQN